MIEAKKFEDLYGTDFNLNYAMYSSIARENYVISKLAFNNNSIYPLILLMEQSIELYVKAYLDYKKIVFPKKGSQGHDILALLKKGKDIITFKEILENKEYISLIKTITDHYNHIRYGESWVCLHTSQRKIYDSLMIKLIMSFFELTNIRGYNIIIINNKLTSFICEDIKNNIKEFIINKEYIQIVLKS